MFNDMVEKHAADMMLHCSLQCNIFTLLLLEQFRHCSW